MKTFKNIIVVVTVEKGPWLRGEDVKI